MHVCVFVPVCNCTDKKAICQTRIVIPHPYEPNNLGNYEILWPGALRAPGGMLHNGRVEALE